MKVLNAGEVNLVSYYPQDNPELAIVNSARISFRRKSEELSERDIGLLRFLMRERHGTPFEMVDFTFHVKCPIFVAREWFRHRIASYNELSLRYTKLDNPEFYIPETNAIRTQVGKPGAYYFESIEDSDILKEALEIINNINIRSKKAYERLIDMGVAKELARIVLPLGIYTEFIFKVNLRSLLNFLSLRNSSHALREIRLYAMEIENLITPIIPNVMKFFNEFDRRSP